MSQLFRLCDDRGLHSSAPAGVDRSGRGCNPRPARGGDSTPLPLRGWIVPVGGSTPDRLKVGGSTSDRLKVGGKAGFYHNFSACVTTRDSTPPPLRGWIVPVGDSIPDRRGGGLHSSAPAGVDRSGRGFNPRPAQSIWRGAGWFVKMRGKLNLAQTSAQENRAQMSA